MSSKKFIVITGTSTGIGEACVLYLDYLGFYVFAGVRKAADGQALQRKASDRLRTLYLDVTDAGSIHAAAETVTRTVETNGLWGLVNNAGIAIGGPLEYMPLDDFRRQLEINLTGQLAVTQAFLPLLRQAQGRIVNMSSIGGRLATPFLAPYQAAKFALEAMSDALRVELHSSGIQVAVIEPGAVLTPIWDGALGSANELLQHMPPEGQHVYGQAMANMRQVVLAMLKRGIPPHEVAQVVAHALTARRARTRYLVGRNAHLRALIARLPDRVRDQLMLRQLRGKQPR